MREEGKTSEGNGGSIWGGREDRGWKRGLETVSWLMDDHGGRKRESNRSLVVFGVACLAVSRRSLRSFLAERRPKTYRRALYVPLSGGGCKRGLHRYCHHHSLKTYSRALPGSASLCPVVVASERDGLSGIQRPGSDWKLGRNGLKNYRWCSPMMTIRTLRDDAPADTDRLRASSGDPEDVASQARGPVFAVPALASAEEASARSKEARIKEGETWANNVETRASEPQTGAEARANKVKAWANEAEARAGPPRLKPAWSRLRPGPT
ncbi:uncharacterized protein ISCGN_013348 [Ixodes scapularis]